jgi:MYXO-CTERM domain-containing protein
MKRLQTHARFGLLMSALALMSVPSAVSAQETCATDGDCDHGYSCEVVGGCPDIDCAEGSACEAMECEPAMGCLPVTDCDADADCAEGWECASDERSDCGDIAEPTCAPGEEGCMKDPADVPECNTVTVTYCTPPWALPCEEAADCGAGFECVEQIAMMCSGSSGGGGSDPAEPTPSGDPQPEDGGSADFAPPAEGDPLPPDDPGSCTSTPTGEFYCKLIETTCEADADCAAGLSCQEAPSDAVCSNAGGDADSPGSDAAGAGGAGAAGAGGDNGAGAAERPAPPECETPEPSFACAPPSYFDGYGWGYDHDGRGENTSGGGLVTPDNGGGDGDGPSGEPPAAPSDDDENASGEEGAAGSGMMSESSSGCSATSSSRASGSALLMVLAVLGLALRRRTLRA